MIYLLIVDGLESSDQVLHRCRELAASKGLLVGEEIIEAVRSLGSARPRWSRLRDRIKSGEVQGLVGAQVSDWFRSTPATAQGLIEWLERGMAVYTLDGIASDLAGRAELSAVLSWWARQQKLRAARAVRLGIARRRQSRATWGRGNARVPISEQELIGLFERGLSVREVARALAQRKLKVSRETVRVHILDLVRSGRIDSSKRSAAIAERGGLPTGGRPRRKRRRDA